MEIAIKIIKIIGIVIYSTLAYTSMQAGDNTEALLFGLVVFGLLIILFKGGDL